MRKFAALHMAEHTNMYELHSHVCDSKTRSTPNFHKNLELIVVLDGTCHLTVENSSYVMKTGEAAFVMPYQIHNFSVDKDSHIRCTVFHESLVNSMHGVVMSMCPIVSVFTPSKPTYDYFCCQISGLFGENSGELKTIEPESKRLKFKGLLYALRSSAKRLGEHRRRHGYFR